MKVRNVRDSIKIALEFGIDTAGPTSQGATGMEGIKTVSSDELEAFHSVLKECNSNSKSVIIDAFDKE